MGPGTTLGISAQLHGSVLFSHTEEATLQQGDAYWSSGGFWGNSAYNGNLYHQKQVCRPKAWLGGSERLRLIGSTHLDDGAHNV
jgi:hypothetical protein